MTGMHILLSKAAGDGSFEFAPDGEPAIVAKVHDAHGDLADFVAWQPERPGRWWLRRGDIAVLGGHALEVANYHGDNIRLLETPQDWFRSGGDDVCILLWAAPLVELFDGVGTVECDSPELQQRFVKALRRWEPCITTRREARHVA